MRMRGATILPFAAASLKPTGQPPASRTVVTPASSVRRARSAASKASSVGGVRGAFLHGLRADVEVHMAVDKPRHG